MLIIERVHKTDMGQGICEYIRKFPLYLIKILIAEWVNQWAVWLPKTVHLLFLRLFNFAIRKYWVKRNLPLLFFYLILFIFFLQIIAVIKIFWKIKQINLLNWYLTQRKQWTEWRENIRFLFSRANPTTLFTLMHQFHLLFWMCD